MSKNKLSYNEALEIALKGTYYPQETNHAGMPLRKVTCDYCGKDKLGSSWKISLDHDLCMNCYVKLQFQNSVNTQSSSVPHARNVQNMPQSFTQGFNNDFFKNSGLDWLLNQDWNTSNSNSNSNNNNNNNNNSNSNNKNNTNFNNACGIPKNGVMGNTTRNAGDVRNGFGSSFGNTRSTGFADNNMAWSQDDNTNSYANRVITEDDDWKFINNRGMQGNRGNKMQNSNKKK
jgi:hypothetical protein